MSKRVGDWADQANEDRDLSTCPPGAQFEENFGTRYQTGQTFGRICFAIEIRSIIKRCDRSGILLLYLERQISPKEFKRCRRETCRHCVGSKCQRALDDDLLRLRDLLRKGGKPCE